MKTLIMALTLVSSSAFANSGDFSFTPAKPETFNFATIQITGEAANNLFDLLDDAAIEYNGLLLKDGNGINCEKSISTAEVSCNIPLNSQGVADLIGKN